MGERSRCRSCVRVSGDVFFSAERSMGTTGAPCLEGASDTDESEVDADGRFRSTVGNGSCSEGGHDSPSRLSGSGRLLYWIVTGRTFVPR